MGKKSKDFVNYPEKGQKYRHYKGGKYKVKYLEKHSETDEVMVSYKSVTFGSRHTRPLSIWNSMAVDSNGKKVERFVLIKKKKKR